MTPTQRRAIRPDPGASYPDWPVPDATGTAAPAAGDWYVTVDERVESVVEVVVADWPQVDEAGLRFDGEITTASFDQAELQGTVDRLRSDAQQLERPLRIGDSFWVRGSDRASLETWQELRDITAEARSMAKTVASLVAVGALYGEPELVAALASVEGSDEAAEAADVSVAEPPPPSGASTANPVL